MDDAGQAFAQRAVEDILLLVGVVGGVRGLFEHQHPGVGPRRRRRGGEGEAAIGADLAAHVRIIEGHALGQDGRAGIQDHPALDDVQSGLEGHRRAAVEGGVAVHPGIEREARAAERALGGAGRRHRRLGDLAGIGVVRHTAADLEVAQRAAVLDVIGALDAEFGCVDHGTRIHDEGGCGGGMDVDLALFGVEPGAGIDQHRLAHIAERIDAAGAGAVAASGLDGRRRDADRDGVEMDDLEERGRMRHPQRPGQAAVAVRHQHQRHAGFLHFQRRQVGIGDFANMRGRRFELPVGVGLLHGGQDCGVELILEADLLAHGVDDVDDAAGHHQQQRNQKRDDDAEIAGAVPAQSGGSPETFRRQGLKQHDLSALKSLVGRLYRKQRNIP